MTSPIPGHDDIELRLAEAAASGEAPAASDAAHAASCESCGRLVAALRALAAGLHEDEPDASRWRAIDEGLRRRTGRAPRAHRLPAWRMALPVAAALALAAVLWGALNRQAAPETETAVPLGAPVEDIVAAASTDSLEIELRTLGLDEGWDVEAEGTAVASEDAGGLPAPVWGDVLGEVEEDLGPLDESQQQALADALRQAT